MHGFGGWSFIGMHAVWWIFWVLLLVALFAWIVPSARSGSSPRSTPLERLQQRYANGEISTEEYEERKRTLERDAAR